MIDADSPSTRAGASPRLSDVHLGISIAMVMLAPFVAFLVWALTRSLFSPGDVALTEIAVRDVGGGATPLLGAYSRYGWHHPGPLLVYVLAGPYRLLGSDGSALAAGAVLLNAAAVAGSAVLLWRRGRVGGLLIGALVVGILIRSMGSEVVTSPWNPLVTVLPMLVFVLAVWSITGGDRWLLPVVVAVGSLIVQAHVGTGVVVAAGLVAAVIAVVTSRRAAPIPRRLWIVSGAVGAALWLAPIIEAVGHRGGNVRKLVAFWFGSHGELTGWARAARVIGAEFAADAPWVTGHYPQRGFSPGVDPGWALPVVAIAFVIALVVARRRELDDAGRLGAITIGFTIVAWLSVARIVDEPFDYLIRWTALAGALMGLTIGWVLLGWVRARARVQIGARVWGATGVAASALIAGVTIALAGVSAVGAFAEPPEILGEHRVFERLAPRLGAAGRSFREPVLVESLDDLSSGGLAADVLATLDGAGIDARYPRALEWQVGDSHAVDPHRARTRLLVGYGDGIAPLLADPRYELIAGFDELTTAERRELDAAGPAFGDFTTAARWSRRHPEAAERLARLSRRSARGAIFLHRP